MQVQPEWPPFCKVRLFLLLESHYLLQFGRFPRKHEGLNSTGGPQGAPGQCTPQRNSGAFGCPQAQTQASTGLWECHSECHILLVEVNEDLNEMMYVMLTLEKVLNE